MRGQRGRSQTAAGPPLLPAQWMEESGSTIPTKMQAGCFMYEKRG